MEYLFSLLLLGLNLFNYEHPMNGILFFIAGLVLFCGLFYFCKKKSKDYMTAYLMMMCHTWPISWINIFGRPSEEFQITWFYLVGLLVLFYFFGHLNDLKNREVSAVVLGIYVAIVIISVYPLVISPSISRGLKEFIMIGFFLVLTFVALLMSGTFNDGQRRLIINSYIFCIAVSCVLLIFQYAYYNIFGEEIFKYSVGNYMGKVMASSNLLMEDTSSATIMLATGVFYMLERINKKEKRFLYVVLIIITVVGMALTTRRTSILSLALCLVLYVPIVYKGTMKKVTMMCIVVGVIAVMLAYLAMSRSIEDISELLYSNGRITNYTEAVQLFLKKPFGVGYDNHNLSLNFSAIIPHNTFLRWLNMGGFIFASLMVFVLFYILKTAHKKGYTDDFWAMFCSLLAMNFIPDILNARFFVILCMIVFMSAPKEKSMGGTIQQPVLKKQLKARSMNG